ncbi:MAG: copper resistance protein [Hyphomicrobiales bacterium]
MSDPLDALALVRAVHLLATVLVSGAVFFRVFVAEPALGCASATLPGRMRARLRDLLAINLAVATISGAAWLGLLAARIGDTSFLDAFGETAWTLLTQTQFGTVWQLRFALAFVLAAGLWRSTAGATPIRNIIAIAASACFVGTLAWSGHGAATPGTAGDLHLLADILHLIAAAAWLGGLLPLVMLMRWMIRSTEKIDPVSFSGVLHRFSNLGLIAVATLVVTGALNTYFILGDADALFAGDYGRVLLAKLTLFAVMLAFAAVNRLKLTPDLASAQADPAREARLIRRIRLNAAAEAGLGIAIVVLVGRLGIIAPSMASQLHLH